LYGEPSSRFALFTVDEKNGQLDTPNFFVAVLKYPENRDGLVPRGYGSTEYIKNMEMVVVVLPCDWFYLPIQLKNNETSSI
jgi:hypothetical protein